MRIHCVFGNYIDLDLILMVENPIWAGDPDLGGFYVHFRGINRPIFLGINGIEAKKEAAAAHADLLAAWRRTGGIIDLPITPGPIVEVPGNFPGVTSMLEAIPLPALQSRLAAVVEDALDLGRTKSDFTLHELLSLSHYLKDARRWAYVYQNFDSAVEPDNLTPEEFKKWVDSQLATKDSGG